jgi:hypothetical protein
MGSDPLLGAAPLSVPVGIAVCLIALAAMVAPIHRGQGTSRRRRRTIALSCWACLTAVALAAFVQTTPGLHGFILLAAITVLAAATLWRSHYSPA